MTKERIAEDQDRSPAGTNARRQPVHQHRDGHGRAHIHLYGKVTEPKQRSMFGELVETVRNWLAGGARRG